MSYRLSPSYRKDKKFMVELPYGKTVHFGAKGYSDYTKHHDYNRMKRYVARHKARENWNKSGIDTAGFWSRWILWNKPGLMESIRDTEKRFNINIIKSRK
jgi:hypothetical protein